MDYTAHSAECDHRLQDSASIQCEFSSFHLTFVRLTGAARACICNIVYLCTPVYECSSRVLVCHKMRVCGMFEQRLNVCGNDCVVVFIMHVNVLITAVHFSICSF